MLEYQAICLEIVWIPSNNKHGKHNVQEQFTWVFDSVGASFISTSLQALNIHVCNQAQYCQKSYDLERFMKILELMGEQ